MSDMSYPRLVGVFHADGGLNGELRYMIGKVRGTAHCELCDITHGLNPLGKKQWRELSAELPLPIELVHLNEMDTRTAVLVSEATSPAIAYLGESANSDHVLLNREQIGECGKDPQKLYDAIIEALTA